jgi:hypothetical protein
MLVLSLALFTQLASAQSTRVQDLCAKKMSPAEAELPELTVERDIAAMRIVSERAEQDTAVEKLIDLPELLEHVDPVYPVFGFFSPTYQVERLGLKHAYSELGRLHEEIMTEAAQLLSGFPEFDSERFQKPTDFRLARLQKDLEHLAPRLKAAGHDPSAPLKKLEDLVIKARQLRRTVDRVVHGHHPGAQVEHLISDRGPWPFYYVARTLLEFIDKSSLEIGGRDPELRREVIHLIHGIFFETVAQLASLSCNGHARLWEVQEIDLASLIELFRNSPLPQKESALMAAFLEDIAPARETH